MELICLHSLQGDFNITNAFLRKLIIKTYYKNPKNDNSLSPTCERLSHTYIQHSPVPSLLLNFSQGSAVITGPVVRDAAVRWPTERSISVFTDLIQYGLFKLAGQGEIRLYLLGMDFCLAKAARAVEGRGELQGPTLIWTLCTRSLVIRENYLLLIIQYFPRSCCFHLY